MRRTERSERDRRTRGADGPLRRHGKRGGESVDRSWSTARRGEEGRMGASRRDRRASRLTPLRAFLVGVAWLAVGVLARARFTVRECRGSEGGGALALYVVLSLAIIVWAKIRQGDV